MDNLRKLEINKLIKEFEFIESDFIFKRETISKWDSEFIKSVDNFLDRYPKIKEGFYNKVENFNIGNVSSQVINNNSLEKEEDIDLELDETIDKDPKLKSLYRKIVKSTHPDKKDDDNLNDIYLKATEAYDNNNILSLFSICDRLSIPYDISDDEGGLIKSEIDKIKNRITFLESTYTWRWLISDDDLVKEQIILSFIKSQVT